MTILAVNRLITHMLSKNPQDANTWREIAFAATHIAEQQAKLIDRLSDPGFVTRPPFTVPDEAAETAMRNVSWNDPPTAPVVEPAPVARPWSTDPLPEDGMYIGDNSDQFIAEIGGGIFEE